MHANRHGQNMGLCHAREGRVHKPVYPNVSYRGRNIKYVISFNPRLLVDGLTEHVRPIETVIHELWHIDTKCDGGIRRERHGKRFNAIVKDLLDVYLMNGGKDIPFLSKKEEVKTRSWKSRKSPSIAYIRRDSKMEEKDALESIKWKSKWSEKDITEKRCLLEKVIPKTYKYKCPNGHKIECHVKFKKPRSCSLCSDTYDKKYIYSITT
jgi:hypothetical protein